MQFIPIVERTTEACLPLANLGWGERPGSDRLLYTQHGGFVTERSVGAEQFGRFLIAIFDEWVRRDVGNVFVQTFDVALGSWLGQHWDSTVCASSRPPAATPSLWSTTAICIPAITMWNPNIGWGISGRRLW
jgi:sulfatase maturation enzyme AslB (radical SAM superfamily)